ncbi:tyrosine recombinase XerC [Brevibacillus agri]|uniref:Integrase n=1 Tax=Brevibacillus agri TaxID=51101 RepID=A0A3M8ASZ1_9BACL|nr:tyrosine-type recombinase/integrase [Brevibacillus agri]MDN4094167.1 tyrosine-type recombinase/integrase [Brevibacillus agri]QAV13227.1 integrase [Brevibacillus agri]RNB54133.1 integrase [Brevibacillus agri]GED25195.1 tyrosine recombinase XerC [Brevibacillus agri]
MLLKFAIKDFKDDREFKNLSPKTIESYMSALNEFQDYCGKQEIVDVSDVTPNTVKNYLMYCQKERNNNVTTRNSKLHVLKIFFNYLEEIEVITQKQNPAKKIGYGKEDIKIEVFQDRHIQQMLGYYRRLKQREKSFFAYRDYTMIVFLLGTGVRLGEMVNLSWNEVDLKNGTIIVFGKKRQQSSIPITEKLIKELCEYRVYCEQTFGEVPQYVFTDVEGKKLTDNAVKCVFKRLKEIMNFPDCRLSAHTFRHTFAHRMLMNGCDVFTLQKMLRHSNIAMTQRYLAIWGVALASQNEKFNPLNSLEI